jgi:predicted transcriptional regulator
MTQTNDPIKSSGQQEITGEMLEILKIITLDAKGVEIQNLATKLSISEPRANYYLDELRERKFVRTGVSLGGPTNYYPTKEGRKYLFEKGLL